MSIKRIQPGPRMSKAVVHGDTVYLAGQVAANAAGKSVADQTTDILGIIDGLLAEAGTDKSKLLMVNIWLSDMSSFAEMNAVWDKWVIAGATPGRATVEAKLASPQYTVEIAVIAAKLADKAARSEREAPISQSDQIASLLARAAGRNGLPPLALAAMAADWLRRQDAGLPDDALLDRKAADFRALAGRLALPLGGSEIRRLRGEAAGAIAAGRFAEADKALALAELDAIGGSSDLSALPLERRLLIGENRADRAALSFLRTTPEAYREAASRYGEASALIGLSAIERSREVAHEQASALMRISADFGGRDGYDAAIAALRRLLEGLDSLKDTIAFATAEEALSAALDGLSALSGETKLLNEALRHCRAGLKDLGRDAAPGLWRALKLRRARLAMALGTTQLDESLLEEAIVSFAGALAVWRRDDDEAGWLEAEHMIARTRATLGRQRGDLGLLERAFNGLDRVAKATDRGSEPMRWAALQDQMGAVLAAMGERYSEPVVIEEAIAAFAAALEEHRQDRAPLLWAQTLASQAEAMLQLARRNKDTRLTQQALGLLMTATETARRAPDGGPVAADLQKRLAAAAAKMVGG